MKTTCKAKKRAKNDDDAPELTNDWFEGADLKCGDQIIRSGRSDCKLTNKVVGQPSGDVAHKIKGD
jgi:hypothetical protein